MTLQNVLESKVIRIMTKWHNHLELVLAPKKWRRVKDANKDAPFLPFVKMNDGGPYRADGVDGPPEMERG